MVTTDNPKSYFDKARRFDQDRLMQIERSNRIAWSIAIASGIVASVSVFAIAGLTPLKTVEPFVVRVDNSTGIVDVVSALTATAGTYDEAVTKYFAAKYVRAREVMSGARHKKTSARSPFYRPNRNRRASQPCIGAATRIASKRLRPNCHGEDRYRVDLLINQNVVSVRYMRTTTRGEEVRTTHWVATLTFSYVNAPMSSTDRLVNPLGFVVSEYRADPEEVR